MKRALVALSAGYVLMYYSELVFWARYDPVGMALPDLLFTYLIYSLVTYIFLSVITRFQVRTFWALFLAGAVYGWLIEGVIVQTMYDSFPLQISFTGLAWHSLISVMVGWYYVLNILLQNSYKKTTLTAGVIGLFYGLWAICWWTEEGIVTPVSEFALYAVVTSAVLVGCYWMYNRLCPSAFEPTKIEWIILIIVVLFFYSFTVLVQPAALLVLPPLLGLVYLTLRRNRNKERRRDLIGVLRSEIKPLNYGLLFLIPLVAVVVYAFFLFLDLPIPTHIFVYVVATPLGFAAFILSVLNILFRK